MLEQTLRHHYQRVLVDPLVCRLNNRITPLSITWLSGFFGLLFIPCLLLHKPFLAISCLLISGYLDTLDGSIARFQGKSSDFGSAMDIIIDRIVEFAVIFAFYLFNPIQNAFSAILMLGSILLCITSFLVVGIFTNNNTHKSFHYSPGLMERAEAFIFFIAMTLYPGYFNPLAWLFCILVCFTALIRMMEFKKNSHSAR
ncbi:CDP-alcohol phosphatidyltransferase family protein [Legionella quateirensis]|uniref:Cytochrome oxidase-like protein n=1 Tax=Legionella quateirensis TaxID=45072 RepID=A0A378KQ79_9GAMM|nr:CDP-alcohol phosphatidyltransferase family protein [Legionella quateirensis]KTD52941.1 cytochrome oxidase-like protein [Legionella quateirensis]STY16329.1 cytochrome oxidase-like protein [Legionella quateirensis]